MSSKLLILSERHRLVAAVVVLNNAEQKWSDTPAYDNMDEQRAENAGVARSRRSLQMKFKPEPDRYSRGSSAARPAAAAHDAGLAFLHPLPV